MRLKTKLAVCFAASLLGCKEDLGYRGYKYQTHDMPSTVDNVRLPTKLWNLFEDPNAVVESKESHGDEGHGEATAEHGAKSDEHSSASEPEHGEAAEGAHESGGAKKSKQKPTELVPLKVYLFERNKGILGGENHLLSYGQGGGELDLKDFLVDKSGSFHISIEPQTKFPLDNMRVYFLSHSKRRKIGDELFGSGCNTYFEITSAFKKALAHEGLLANTTQARHLSALAGTYFFVIDHENKLYLSRLTIRDSRYSSLLCAKRD